MTSGDCPVFIKNTQTISKGTTPASETTVNSHYIARIDVSYVSPSYALNFDYEEETLQGRTLPTEFFVGNENPTSTIYMPVKEGKRGKWGPGSSPLTGSYNETYGYYSCETIAGRIADYSNLKDYSYTAVYENAFTLTMEGNGGTVTMGTGSADAYIMNLVYSSYSGFSYPETYKNAEATRSGYTFNGWYCDEACTVPFLGFDDTDSVNAAYEKAYVYRIYAGWTKNTTDIYSTCEAELEAKTSISKLTSASKAFTVKWKKKTTQVTGYELQYSTSKKFTKNTTTKKTITDAKTISKKISKLKAKKKFTMPKNVYRTFSSHTMALKKKTSSRTSGIRCLLFVRMSTSRSRAKSKFQKNFKLPHIKNQARQKCCCCIFVLQISPYKKQGYFSIQQAVYLNIC